MARVITKRGHRLRPHYRMWELYLTGCDVAFRYMNQMVFRAQVTRRQEWNAVRTAQGLWQPNKKVSSLRSG